MVFLYLVEENYTIASFHRVYASIKPDNSKLIADMLVPCDEDTRIIHGKSKDKDLGHRK
ncbi:RNA-binding protein [Francisella sp. TX07-6608]|uniref:RNA-binding protein n=1 Tax=Francisella sp. TX07-6608 TaxID=573568 RepID=UPI00091AE841|nr:RNA-binding protein [Francisella sp. TX07-6608]OIN84499.1 hypothetical protein KX00_29 [Francisella sp. TX07-6608]